jgi:Carboxypeptidase regulatory-like domain
MRPRTLIPPRQTRFVWPRTLSLLLALFPFPTFGEQFAVSDVAYPIRGTVVNSITGEPIRGALVQIFSNRQRSVLTGADGSFQFADVPTGTVNLNVQKPGFFTARAIKSPRAQASFAISGPDQPRVVLKLIPEGVISGHISGDGGEAVEGMSVQLMAERLENGKRTRVILKGASTDERGEYRIADLQPGKYFVFVGASKRMEAFAATPTQQGARGYAATFYPSGNDFATANPVEVAAGQRAEINFNLRSQFFHRISGTVSGYPQGTAGINLQVTDAAGQQMQAGFRFDQAGGTFRTLWLPAGAYTLTAEMQNPENGQVYFAAQNLSLTSDVAGVHLQLAPGLNIPVTFRVERTRNDSPAAETQSFFVFGGGRGAGRRQVQMNVPARVALIPQGGALSQQQRFAQPGPGEDSLEVAEVPPGVYTVQVFPNGPYYVQSARSGSLNLQEQDLTVAPGSSVDPIEVVLRDDFASLEGSVTFGAESDSVTVIAIPEGARPQMGGVGLSRPTPSRDSSHAAAVFATQLAPGNYKILAVDRPDDFEYGNPEVLRKYLSKAQEISLVANQHAKIELEVVHIGE